MRAHPNSGATRSLGICSLFALGLDKVNIKHPTLEWRARVFRDYGQDQLGDGPGKQPFWDNHPGCSSSTTTWNHETLTLYLFQYPALLLIKEKG